MCNNFGVTLAFVLVFSVCVRSNPIIIRSGVVNNQGQEQNANQYEGTQVKGIANFEGDQGFNNKNENKLVYSSNLGRYGETAGNRKDHVNEGKFDKDSFYQSKGGDVTDHEAKVGHKKGHHKSGFHNSYHKDESGSNSSFFEDGNDQGDDYVRKNHQGTYGNAAEDARHGGNYDSSHLANNGAKQNQYENTGRYAQDNGNRQNYNRNQYQDEREAANRRNAANNFGSGGRYEEENYKEQPYYGAPYRDSVPYNRPYTPRKHITIYEDPRYVGRSAAPYRQYDDDYIELDIKPLRNENRFYDRRSPYDYY